MFGIFELFEDWDCCCEKLFVELLFLNWLLLLFELLMLLILLLLLFVLGCLILSSALEFLELLLLELEVGVLFLMSKKVAIAAAAAATAAFDELIKFEDWLLELELLFKWDCVKFWGKDVGAGGIKYLCGPFKDGWLNPVFSKMSFLFLWSLNRLKLNSIDF